MSRRHDSLRRLRNGALRELSAYAVGVARRQLGGCRGEDTKALVSAVQTGDFGRVIDLLGDSGTARFLFLARALPLMPVERAALHLTTLWTGNKLRVPSSLALRLFRSVDLRYTIPNEWPDTVILHRGVRATDRRRARAQTRQVSWTMQRDTAILFAGHRQQVMPSSFQLQPFIAAATIARDRILAFIETRGEDECIVDPRDLRNIKIMHVPQEEIARVTQENVNVRP